MNTCIRCNTSFSPRFPKSKICKKCSKRGAKRGQRHWNYKDGSFTYESFRKEVKEEIRFCQRCDKDLLKTSRYEWCVHHIDHNHYNNQRINLELLCKRCHQIEHEVHRNFQGATTISKESSK
jgi:hypothetical protein